MSPSEDGSDKSRTVALALGFVLGPLGAHRYYVGKVGTGVMQTVTLGGLGLWWLYDMILITFGSFRDAEGLRVKYWTEDEAFEKGVGTNRQLPDEALEELYALRDEVADLTERVDFTERLLTRGRNEFDREESGYRTPRHTPR
jgi:TM2 domain-containing membrane protein YozV